MPLPRGRELVGSALYGLLAFGVTFSLINWGLVEAPAGLAQVLLALVPLLTLLLAVVQRLERFRLQSLLGSMLAIAGVGLVFADQVGSSIPILSMGAILLGAVSIAEGNVVAKRLPHGNPVGHNAVGMAAGALVLVVLSIVIGEPRVLPSQLPTILSLGYLVVIGSVVVFTLYLHVITRWTASATSYSLLLMPLVSVIAAAVLLGEPITVSLIGGAGLVIVGVYIGAFAPSLRRPLPGLFTRPGAASAVEDGPPALSTPNCP